MQEEPKKIDRGPGIVFSPMFIWIRGMFDWIIWN